MRNILECVASVVLAAAAATAWSEAPTVYLAAGVGAGYSANGSLHGADAKVDFDLARPVAALALGLETGRGWRFELDGAHRYNDAEVVYFDDGRADLAPDSDSRIMARSLGLNAIYEPDLGLGFQPYLGAGVATARVDYEISEYLTGIRLLDDDDAVVAYQLMAGFGLPLTRRLALQVDYRYWHASDIRLEAVDGTRVETRYQVHSAMASLRYRMSAGAPTRSGDADRLRGWYVHGHGGMSFAKDAEIKDNIANFDAFDVGPVVTLAVGRALGDHWRVELEGVRSRHEAELIDFNPEFGEDRADGRVESRSLMLNVAYEPDWNEAFRPYLGLGLGVAWSDWDVRLQADDAVYVDDEARTGAAQLMLGAAGRLTDRMEVTAEFRYGITDLFDLAQPDGRPMRTELTINSLLLGVRYAFR